MKDLAAILELPPAERLEIPESIPVSEAVRDELDRRLEAYYANPDSARPWDEIKDELFGKSETAADRA
ncbi:MAG TPA: addiction module protein [Thermoanaerobaculia bacterium]|nr:addiction module protein [Thermoanaerobaculia bacterium]